MAWKWLGDKQCHCVSIKPSSPLNDTGVVDTFYHVLKDADIIIGHNIKTFDVKKFNAKVVEYGYHPVLFKPYQVIDTLSLCRKYFKFTSNKLSYVAHKLGLDAKDESPEWDKVLQGDADEIRYMRKYNKQDVIVNEQIYEKIKGWHETHPNLNVHNVIRDIEGREVLSCPNCQSTETVKMGLAMRKNGYKQTHRCNGCGRRFAHGRLVKVTNYD